MNKKSKIWNLLLLVIAIVLLMTSSCKKDDPNVAPGVVTLITPANAATNVASYAFSLTWSLVTDPDGDAVTYDVYFGTAATPATVASTEIGKTYTPTLEVNTTYYWKVVAKDGKGGTSESAVWSFTTDLIAWSDATHGTFTDERDGHVYDVVKIGDQTWFAENLAYEIPGKNITDNTVWENNTAYDGWCYFDNNKPSYGGTYGVMYQWEAAKTACPSEWHLATDAEWTTLTYYLGSPDVVGGKLKEFGTPHWASPNTGATNETGFTALPGGRRDDDGSFVSIGFHGYFWSSTELSSQIYAYYRSMHYDLSNLKLSAFQMEQGISARCVRD